MNGQMKDKWIYELTGGRWTDVNKVLQLIALVIITLSSIHIMY